MHINVAVLSVVVVFKKIQHGKRTEHLQICKFCPYTDLTKFAFMHVLLKGTRIVITLDHNHSHNRIPHDKLRHQPARTSFPQQHSVTRSGVHTCARFAVKPQWLRLMMFVCFCARIWWKLLEYSLHHKFI